MEKYKKNGLVAVLVSPDYGAGWYTWNDNCKELLFDPNIVQLILDKVSKKEILEYCEKKYPDAYFGGIDGLCIHWVPEGTIFRIDEYDGYETLVPRTMDEWLTA